MIRLYICQNKDGSLYIDKNAKDGEIAAYLQEVAGWESVRELVANVNTRYQEACVKDEALENLAKLAAGSNNLNMLIKGNRSEIQNALAEVEGIKQIKLEKSSEENTSESVSETVYDAESQADEA